MATWRTFDPRTARLDDPSLVKRSRSKRAQRPANRVLRIEPFEERTMFSVYPVLQALVDGVNAPPNPVIQITNGETLSSAPTQLTFEFQNGESFNPATLASPTFHGIEITQTLLTPGAVPTQITPGAIVLGTTPNDIIYRFASTLPDATYTVSIAGTGVNALTDINGNPFLNGQNLTETFTVDYGPQITAIVPQPVSQTYVAGKSQGLQQQPNEIDVYFNQDPLKNTAASDPASANNPANYELLNVTGQITNSSPSGPGESIINPASATYVPASNEVKLLFAPGVLTAAATWRLRIGDADPIPVTPTQIEVGPQPGNASGNVYTYTGSSLATAAVLPNLGTNTGQQTVLVTSYNDGTPLDISNGTDPSQNFLQYPGSDVTESHRLIPVSPPNGALAEDYVPNGYGAGGTAVPQIDFNFKSILGYVDTANKTDPYYNVITAQQEIDAESILSLYGNYLGVQFVQTPFSGFTIATGDPNVVDPSLDPHAVGGIASPGIALVNQDGTFGSSPIGGNWFLVAFHEIGHVLGLSHADNTPPLTIMNGGTEGNAATGTNYDGNTVPAESVYPGDVDIVNGQFILPPDVKDVNMFQFAVTQAGTVNLQTIAQRLSAAQGGASLLQTALRVFDSSGNQIAEDERYFGNDSYVSLMLNPGTYYVGISSAGNDAYNPAIADGGGGGNTQGNYQLEVTFTPQQATGLEDAGGMLLDGDNNEQPGGLYNFWFNTQTALNTIYVDKTTPQTVSGTAGSINNPYTTISAALVAAQQGEIVRIEGNDPDNNPNNFADQIPYEIGFNLAFTPLSDGSTMQIPAGVTVMIDPGAILKLHAANIDAGTVSQGISHAGGALQVLGTPQQQVYLTSFNQLTMNGQPFAPDALAHQAVNRGDWGGIVFHGDADHEDAGVFLDYVDEATLTYGGGSVVVNSQSAIYDPIDLISTLTYYPGDGPGASASPVVMHDLAARPTIANNTILNSNDAAMSADPNNFEDSEFLGATGGLQIVGTGSASDPFGFVNGDTFQVIDSNGTRFNFEFITGGGTATPGYNPINFTGTSTAAQIASLVAAAINTAAASAGSPLIATVPTGGTLVSFTGNGGIPTNGAIPTIQTQKGSLSTYFSQDYGRTGPNIHGNVLSVNYDVLNVIGSGVSSNPAPFVNGYTFQLTDQNNVVYKFEFTTGGGTAPAGVIAIPFTATSTAAQITTAIAAAVNGIGATKTTLAATVTAPQQVTFTGTNGNPVIFAPDGAIVTPGLQDNQSNGLFIRIATMAGQVLEELNVTARLSDTDIVYVLSENLLLAGAPGGSAVVTPLGLYVANAAASLIIDPGIIIKANSSRIETQLGNSNLIAEGTYENPIVFTSLYDNTVGAGGSFLTAGHTSVLLPNPGDWGGILFDPVSDGSLDYTQISYGGGTTSIEGGFDNFNAVEIDQARVRVADSLFEFNLAGASSGTRNGRGSSFAATIDIVGAQPIILNNTIQDNTAAAISVNVNSLNTDLVDDWGPSTGVYYSIPQPNPTKPTQPIHTVEPAYTPVAFLSNTGPLVFGNVIGEDLVETLTAVGTGAAADPAGFRNGYTFQITDQSNTVFTFEFVTGAGTAPVGVIPISFTATSTAAQIASLIAAAINRSGSPSLVAVANGAAVAVTGTTGAPIVNTADGALTTSGTVPSTQINGMLVRGGVLTTQVIFDETSIVNVVESEITSPDVTTYGGVRLQSSATQSLVVKLLGATAGFTATGEPGDISGRIGGSVDIIGTPSHPVILTSLNDNSVGAGLTPGGQPDNVTGSNPQSVPSPGDWRSVKLDALSNDNNYLVVNGYQQNTSTDPTQNLTPTGVNPAQYVGELAPNINSGDDSSALGFDIEGTIVQPTNVDVYSFQGTVGTQIWLSIDRTAMALGTVLELVDANGTPLAQAYAVFDPATETYSMQYTGLARPIQQGPLDVPNYYSINPRDASMSVILPGGTPGTVQYYYVRVSSEGTSLPSLTGTTPPTGLTAGSYELQVALADNYQWPGSEVAYANIEYATNGVEVLGQPSQSPLVGDSVSAGGNNSFATAQDLGNLLDTSQSQISVAGSLTSVDWYKFEVNYDLIQRIGGNNATLSWPTIFKVSYADGLVGPDTVLALYDSNGDLLMVGRNSDVADNEPPGQTGAQTNNLLHGSFGNDPLIGSVELPTTTNSYYLAVMPSNLLPATLDQTFQVNATNTAVPTDPLARLEPIDSVARVAEDHVGNPDQGSTAVAPQTLGLTPTPYNLGNVVLYLSTAGGLSTVDPLTGAAETGVGGYTALGGGTGIQDIAMQPGVGLFGFTSAGDPYFPSGTINGANSNLSVDSQDNYAQISTATGATTIVSQDGIHTTDLSPATPPAVQVQNGGAGVGLAINAMTYAGGTLYGVGNRPTFNFVSTPIDGGAGVNATTNLLYSFNAATGIATTPSSPLSLPSSSTPLGQIQTGPVITFPSNSNATVPGTISPTSDIEDGQTVSVGTETFEFDSGNDIQIDPAGGKNTRDQTTFTVTGPILQANGTYVETPETFEFDSGPSLVVSGNATAIVPQTMSSGDTFTLTDVNNKIWTYEFIEAGDAFPVQSGDIPINYHSGDSEATVVSEIVTAINAQKSQGSAISAAVAGAGPGNRITITGDIGYLDNTGTTSTNGILEQPGPAATNFDPGNGPVGSYGVTGGNIPVFFEETDTQAMMGADLVAAINKEFPIVPTVQAARNGVVAPTPTVVASYSNGRIMLGAYVDPVLGPLYASVNTSTFALQSVGPGIPEASSVYNPFEKFDDNVLSGTPGNPTVPAAPGVFNGGDIAVPFQAGDTPNMLATELAYAINGVTATTNVSATVHGNQTLLLGSLGQIAVGPLGPAPGLVPQAPFTKSGYGPGGNITGLAEDNGVLYAVSDSGGLYSVNPALAGTTNGVPNNLATFITQLTNGGNPDGIQFSGLTIGPPDVAFNGQPAYYADTMFATANNKVGNDTLYAFGTTQTLNVVQTGNSLNGQTFQLIGSGVPTASGKYIFTLSEGGVTNVGATSGTIGYLVTDSAAQIATNIAAAITTLSNKFNIPAGTGLTAAAVGTAISLKGVNSVAMLGSGLTYTVPFEPIFPNNQSSVQLPTGGTTGLAFSTLDYNLWHVTASRSGTPGHGIDPSPDDVYSRLPAQAPTGPDTSYYFGLEPGVNFGGNPATDSPLNPAMSNANTINAPGGAMGSLTTNTFDLSQYSTGDDPTLYFDYFIDDAGKSSLVNDTDSFRVFASTNGASWTELATNNDIAAGPNTVSELPQVPSVFGGSYLGEGGINAITGNNTSNQLTQALANNTSPYATNTTATFRQARVDLGDFAGQSNVQLRFDFSSAGSMGVGGLYGSVIAAKPGNQLNLGGTKDTVTVNGNVFTFNTGYVLGVTADGASIPNGTSFSLTGPSGSQTFTINHSGTTGGGAIALSNTDTAEQVAAEIASAVTAANLGVTPINNSMTYALGVIAQDEFLPGGTVIPAEAQIPDGTSFTVNGPYGSQKFTISHSGKTGGGTIVIQNTDFATTVTSEIASAITAAGIGVTANIDATGLTIDLAGATGVTVNTGAAYLAATASSSGTNIEMSGATSLSVGSGSGLVVVSKAPAPPAMGQPPLINVDYTMSAQQVAQLMYAAINNFAATQNDAQLNGAPMPGATASFSLGVTQAAVQILQGAPASFTLGGSLGTQTFTLSTTGVTGGGNIVIQPTDTAVQLTTEIANAITAAGLGVTPIIDATGASMNLTGATSLTVISGTGLKATQLSASPPGSYTPATSINIIGASFTTTLPTSSSLPGDQFGSITGTAPAARNQNNAFEGVYIDDIIVGLAGRGEMVTGATSNTSTFALGTSPLPHKVSYTGSYQLEIGRGSEFSLPHSTAKPGIDLTDTFNINDRLAQGISLTAPAGNSISQGEAFSIFDGTHLVTFQFLTTGTTPNPTNNAIPIFFNTTDSSAQVAAEITSAINTSDIQTDLDVQAGVVGNDKTGNAVGPQVNLFGAVQVLNTLVIKPVAAGTIANKQTFQLNDGGDQQYQSTDGDDEPSWLSQTHTFEFVLAGTTVTPGDYGIQYTAGDTQAQLDSEIAAAITNSGMAVQFNLDVNGNLLVSNSGGSPSGTTPQGVTIGPQPHNVGVTIYNLNAANGWDFPLQGDTLNAGIQGYTLIFADKITNSLDYGISVGPGARIVTTESVPGPVRNLTTLNNTSGSGSSNGLVPGISITNNLLVGNEQGGIQFSGDPNGGPVPFGRIVNNTIYGGFSDAYTVPDGANTLDGQVLTITNATGTTVTFQFIISAPPAPGTIPIDITIADTSQQIATLIANAVNASGLGVNAVAGTGAARTIQFLAAPAVGGLQPVGAASLTQLFQTPTGAQIGPGQTIAVTGLVAGVQTTVTFAFELPGIAAPVGDVAIHFTGAETAAQVATLIANAVNAPANNVGITAVAGTFLNVVGVEFTGPQIVSWTLNGFSVGPSLGVGVGINVIDGAGPSILNNIIANNPTGIAIDATSTSNTVVGYNVFQNNSMNGVTGTNSVLLPSGAPLFVDAANNDFYPLANSLAVSGAEASLQERPTLSTLENTLGLGQSPIIAPITDLFGIFRQTGTTHPGPSGTGSNPAIGFGAIQRADNTDPTATLTTPLANGQTSITFAGTLSAFTINLSDGNGVGVDPATVTAAQFSISFNGTTLTPPTPGQSSPAAYNFSYVASSGQVTLSSATGVWPVGTYVITLANANSPATTPPTLPIADLAGNPLQPNNGATGLTTFTIDLQPALPPPNPFPWQNPANRFEVIPTANGQVLLQDVFAIVVAINNGTFGTAGQAAKLPTITTTPPNLTPAEYYFDVNGDGNISYADAFAVLGFLKTDPSGLAVPALATPSVTASSVSTATTTVTTSLAAASPSLSVPTAAAVPTAVAAQTVATSASVNTASNGAAAAATPAVAVTPATVQNGGVVTVTASNATTTTTTPVAGQATTSATPATNSGSSSATNTATSQAVNLAISSDSQWDEDDSLDGILSAIAPAVLATNAAAATSSTNGKT